MIRPYRGLVRASLLGASITALRWAYFANDRLNAAEERIRKLTEVAEQQDEQIKILVEAFEQIVTGIENLTTAVKAQQAMSDATNERVDDTFTVFTSLHDEVLKLKKIANMQGVVNAAHDEAFKEIRGRARTLATTINGIETYLADDGK